MGEKVSERDNTTNSNVEVIQRKIDIKRSKRKKEKQMNFANIKSSNN